MKNQALQYDNGKYYYREGESTRIEVALESVEMAEDLCYKLSYDGNLLFSLPEGIYPVQVKVNYKYTKKPPYRYAILSEVEDKSNKDNQEKLLVDMMKQDEELGLYEGDSKSTKELIKEVWELWESMAECGELHIGPQFSANYKRLKAQVKQLIDTITPQ